MRIAIGLGMLNMTVIVLLNVAPAAAATQDLELAKQAGCLVCHDIDRKLIGPAFVWMADKYKDDKVAGQKTIIDRIAHGASGQWIRETGGVIMPPFGKQTTEAQREKLADFILSLDPQAPPH
ncbi:MAG: c-type cytochrome [Desulfuromonadaceae bacterium]|jgi:cytochrome c